MGSASGSAELDLPQACYAGAFPSPAGMHRLDGARTALSLTRLPLRPELDWKHYILGGIAASPVVLEDGATVVPTRSGHVARVSSTGLLEWRADIGAIAVAPPALLNDGTIVLLTASAEVIGLDGKGKRKFTRRLVARPEGPGAPLLPLPDGSVVLATDSLMLQLGPTGRVRRQTALSAPAAALVEFGSRPTVVTRTGEVFSWRPDGRLAHLGSFRVSILAGVVRSGDHLLAPTVDGQLTQLDLMTRGRSPRWRGVGARIMQLPAVRQSGSLVALSADGFLLVEPSAGRSPDLIPLVDSASKANKPGRVSRWLPPVVDRHGTAAFAAADLGVGVVHSDGTIHYASGVSCRSPLGLVPSGHGVLVLACGSGLLVSVRDVK